MAVLLLLTIISVVRGDYDCLCCYDVERQVFQQPSNTSKVIGYLYEFDCKEIVRLKTVSNTWNVIAYEHQIGYVMKNKHVDILICAGAVPQADKVTSPLPGGHTTESKQSSTATTQTTITTEQKHTTSVSTQRPSTATTLQPTTATTTIQTTTPTSKTTTYTTTMELTTPSTTTETTTPTTTTQKLTTTVTTSVPTTTRPSTTVPTTAGLYRVNMSTQKRYSITTMSVDNTFNYIEPTRVCPKNLLEAAHLDDGIVVVDMAERKCYELIELHASWSRAVDHCKRNGGQLATIKSSAQNELLHRYVLLYDRHRTWIGLNDYIKSGHFRWAAGDSLSFTNWKENTAPLNAGRCIVMEPVSGKWDDENCIYSFPYICEFDISPNMPGVLVG